MSQKAPDNKKIGITAAVSAVFSALALTLTYQYDKAHDAEIEARNAEIHQPQKRSIPINPDNTISKPKLEIVEIQPESPEAIIRIPLYFKDNMDVLDGDQQKWLEEEVAPYLVGTARKFEIMGCASPGTGTEGKTPRDDGDNYALATRRANGVAIALRETEAFKNSELKVIPIKNTKKDWEEAINGDVYGQTPAECLKSVSTKADAARSVIITLSVPENEIEQTPPPHQDTPTESPSNG